MSEASPIVVAALSTGAHVRRPSSLTKFEDLFDLASAAPAPSLCRPSRELAPQGKWSPCLQPAGHAAIDAEKIVLLQTENKQLQEEIAYLKMEAQVREEELNKFRSDYYAERFQANVRKHLAKSAEENHAARDLRLEQAEKFILSTVELKLHQPVLSDAWKAVAAGAMADDALIDAIKKAAAIPGTSWSRIVPAVVGPRTPDDYLSAVDMTLKVTQKLKNAKKISRFWKNKAKQDASHKDLITPSPSKLSDASFSDEFVGCGNRAVDDLLKQLNASPLQPGPKSLQHVTVPVPPSAGTSRLRSRVPVPQQNTPRGRSLAPLASQVLKDDVMRLSSPAKRSKFSPTKKLRSVFKEIDVNVELAPQPKTWDRQVTKLSVKSPRKRRAVLVERDRPEHTLGVLSTMDASLHSKTSLPLDQNCATPSLHKSADFSTRPSGDTGTFSAEKALESLERICAGFSSGSLGSLAATEASTNQNLQNACAAPVTSDRTPMAGDVQLIRPRPPVTKPSSPSAALRYFKTSPPIESRLRQMRSLSRPSLFYSSQSGPSASLTKATPSPTKKFFLRKRTSPRCATRKAMVGTSTG